MDIAKPARGRGGKQKGSYAAAGLPGVTRLLRMKRIDTTAVKREEAMAECQFLSSCFFFSEQLEDLSLMEALQRKYCRGGSSAQCARYQVGEVLGLGKVPTDLYPGDTIRSRVLIAELSNKNYA